jgi:hypothetical protein
MDILDAGGFWSVTAGAALTAPIGQTILTSCNPTIMGSIILFIVGVVEALKEVYR